jgi:hypothetical protein
MAKIDIEKYSDDAKARLIEGRWASSSEVWDEVRKEFEAHGVHFKNISGKAVHLEHPFINCGLGEYFDHLKGPERKKMGKSLDSDYEN